MKACESDEAIDILDFAEEEEEQQLEVIPPRGQMLSRVLTSKQNRIRENIVKTNLF
mgnify:CR=1 FL=1